MKVLVYSDYSVLNHSVRPEAEIFLQLADMGHDICVCSASFDEKEPFSKKGIKTLVTHQTRKISPKAIRILRKELREGGYDIVFATSSRSIPTAAFACLGLPARLVVYRGTTRGLKRRDPTSFLSVLHPRVDAVITVSQAVSDAVQKKLVRKQVKVRHIFKGHNIEWYKNQPVDLTQHGIPDDAFVAIAVARFRPHKGLDYLLKATNELADIENLHLLVVGSGASQEPYMTLIKESPMRERIHTLGQRSDALSFIAAADALVQASTEGEGLPRSIIEALSFGKPIISTTAGGAKELISDGLEGFIVAPKDSSAIAEKIRFLAKNPVVKQEMKQRCMRLVREELSHTATAKAYEAFFESVLR